MAVLKSLLSCLECLDGLAVVFAEYVEAVNRNEGNDEKENGRLGGGDLSAYCVSNSNLMSHEEVVPYDGEDSAGNGAEKKNEDEVHSLFVYAEFCCDLVVVLGHYVPSVDAVDTAGNYIEEECGEPVKLFHFENPFKIYLLT